MKKYSLYSGVLLILILCVSSGIFAQDRNLEVEHAAENYFRAKQLMDNGQFDKLDSVLLYTNQSSGIYLSQSRWGEYLDNLNLKIQVYARQYQKERVLELKDSVEIIIKQYKLNKLKYTADLDFSLGLYHYLNSQYNISLDYSKQSLEKRIQLYGESNLDVASSYLFVGIIYDKISEYGKALDCMNKSLEIRKKTLGDESVLVALCLSNIGYVYRHKSDLDQALKFMLESLEIRKKVLGEMSYDVAQSYSLIGTVYYDRSELDTALIYFKKSVDVLIGLIGEDNVDVATVYASIGAVYKRLSLYSEAMEYQQRALKIRKEKLGDNHISIAWSYNDIGLIYDDLSDEDTALEYLIKSSEIKKNLLGEKDLDVAVSYNNIGTIYNAKGDFDLALEYHHKALSIRKELLGENHPYVAESYNSIGSVYLNKQDYQKALEYYNKDLSINVNVLGENHDFVALGYLNIGVVYDQLNENDRALDCYEKAMKICNTIYGPSNEYVAKIYNNIAGIFYKQGNYADALNNFYKSIEMKRKVFGTKGRDLSLSYFNVGYMCFESKEYLQALSNAQKAIVSNVISFNDTVNVTTSPQLKGYVDYYTLLYSILLKANVFEFLADSIGDGKTIIDSKEFNKKYLYLLALHNYYLCDSIVNQTRKKIDKQTDKITLGELAYEMYNQALRLTYKLTLLNDKDIEHYWQSMFYFAEQNKGLVLLESIVGTEQIKFAGIPDSLLFSINNMQDQIAMGELKLAQEKDSVALVQCQSNLFDINREYDRLIAIVEQKYPDYFNLKYSFNPPSVVDIQNSLDDKTMLRSYFIGSSNLYIFNISKRKIDAYEISDVEGLEDSIQVYRLALAGEPRFVNSLTSTGLFLFSNLFPDIAVMDDLIEDLVIIPDGSLAFIPFESFPTKDNSTVKNLTTALQDSLRGFKTVGNAYTGGNYSEYPFLIKKYNISYSYSAALYYQSLLAEKSRNSKKRSLSWIGIAPVFSDSVLQTKEFQDSIKDISEHAADRGNLLNGEYITPLPGTESEVKSIYKEFAGRRINASILLKNDATEKNLKSGMLGNYSILHLATHGFVNSEKPELSGILLSQDSTGGNDGILYSGEMYNLKLNADLTVLSACETGLGKVRKGEGIIGLTRALLYAGSKNIMVSLWPVSDQSTSNLMVDFYKNLLKEKKRISYSHWLREAKLKMIEEGKYSNPFYWSPFILIGN